MKAKAKVPIAGNKIKCGKLSGATARSASKVALKKTDIVIRTGLTPDLLLLSVVGCQQLSAITTKANNHP